MPKTVCGQCLTEYQIEKTGVYVIEYASFGPYKIWAADEHRCPNCGSRIITGFGGGPLHVHHEAGFDERIEALKKSPLVRYDFENAEQREQFLNGEKG
jgi:DNA-directed RNA polymerase subunit RPC12/RpoP